MNVAAEAAKIVAQSDWLALATTGNLGSPASSYAPFVVYDGGFAIAVSRLSAHTAHLGARSGASVLVVGETSTGGDAFARPRLSITVEARFIPRGSHKSMTIWDGLEQRFGAIVGTLRELPDFETIVLAPQSARVILGFGIARDLDATELQAVVRAATQVRT